MNLPTSAILFAMFTAMLLIFIVAAILVTNKRARPPGDYVRDGLTIMAAIGAVLFGVFVIAELVGMGRTGQFDAVIVQRFRATVGVPLAAFAAFCIVIGLRASYGTIEFEAAGIKFKGASGPIVLWVVCFLAIVIAIRLLW